MERDDFIRESINFLHRYMMKSLQKQAEDYGVTVPQARVIAEVLSKQTVTIKQLSQNLRMTQSTVSDIVERLTAKGILLKTPNVKDKRSVQISLTDEVTNEINGNIRMILNNSISSILSLLKPNELIIVEEAMRLLVSAAKESMEKEEMIHMELFDILSCPGDNSLGK